MSPKIPPLCGELLDPVMWGSYDRNVGLALNGDLAMLCRRGTHSLLMAVLESKGEAHRHALKLRRGVAQTRI